MSQMVLAPGFSRGSLLVTGGSDAQPLSPDTLALLSPHRVRRQMRGAGYVTTVVDEDTQIGGDIPTRFLISMSEELVASDGHHITLHAGAVSGVTTSGLTIDGLMLSGKKVRDEYPSHWLNSAEWKRFRSEAMNRGEVVFDGIRRLRVRCGSTAAGNDRPIFFQRRGFGGGAFFAREAFVEAQLADDYLLLDDGIPVDSYTAEFYKKRPFIGVRPDRIRPGEVFDLTITVCDPESFDNLLIPRDDGLRTPDVRVKVNDVDITPALAEKFAGFNPFGFPSGATSPYPGFRLVWPQMKIDEEMPLKLEVEVRDALSNVNQVITKYSITRLEGLVDFFDFPRGLYQVPASQLAWVRNHGFNIATNDNYTAACCSGCDTDQLDLPAMLKPWLDRAKDADVGLKTLASWVGLGEMACPQCDWEDRTKRCFVGDDAADPAKIDIVAVVDEPRPIRTVEREEDPPSLSGCSYLGPGESFACWPLESANLDPEHSWDWLKLADYDKWTKDGEEYLQVFFAPTERRVQRMCYLLNQIGLSSDQRFRPLFINLFAQGHPGDAWAFRRKEIWRKFMKYCHYFSIDYYPVKWGTPLTRVACFLDEMHEAREQMWAAGNTAEENWVEDWKRCGLPFLWFVLDFGDWWSWGFGSEDDPHPGWSWRHEIGDPSRRRCPTEDEYKAMTYLAITHGAKGLLYHRFPENECRDYNPYRPPTRTPPIEPPEVCFEDSPNCRRQWRVAKETNRELKTLSPIINGADSREILFIAETPATTPLSFSAEMVVERIEETVGPIHSAQRPAISDSIHRSLEQLSLEGEIGLGGSDPIPTPLEQADTYDYRIHCLGRTGTAVNAEIHPKQRIFHNYIVTVNGSETPTVAAFICMWVPGFHREIPAWEVQEYLAEVMFENRSIPLVVVPDWRPPWLPLFTTFVDVFRPYERHVYKVRSGAWDPVLALFEQPVLQQIVTKL